MIKAILFDLGQTLVDSSAGFKQAEKAAQKKIFDDLALGSQEEFLSNYRRIRQEQSERSVFSRKVIWQEVYWYYCREGDAGLLKTWEREYWDTVRSQTKLFPETIAVLKVLASKRKLGLITNTEGRSDSEHRLNDFPQLRKHFDAVVIAGVGDIPAKPDVKAFTACLEHLGIEAAEAVFVGDDQRIDICGAQDAGVQPVWLQHHTVARNWPQAKTDAPVITSLKQVLDLDNIIS